MSTAVAEKEIHSVNLSPTQTSIVVPTNPSPPIYQQPSFISKVKSKLTGSSLSNKKILCPFCCCEYEIIDLPFRCQNSTCKGQRIDAIFAHAHQETPKVMGNVLVPNKLLLAPLKVLECDICKKDSGTRICPVCHSTLGNDVGQVDWCSLSIIGGSDRDQMCYIAALITCLKSQIGRNLNFTVQMIDKDTQVRWEEDYYKPIFINRKLPLLEEASATMKRPLVLRLTFTNGKRRRAINLSFNNVSSNDIMLLDKTSPQVRRICGSQGIIFLFDPLQQIAIVRNQVVELREYESNVIPDYLIGRLRDFFEWQTNLPMGRQIETPFAFTLSKTHLLLPILSPDSALRYPGDYRASLDLAYIQSLSTEVVNYLYSWMGSNFCSIISDNFAHYSYFAISSLGEEPNSDMLLRVVSPLHVEDPFLWILYRLGFLTRT